MPGHMGHTRTLHRIIKQLFWPGCKKDIKSWIMKCIACQRRKCGPRTVLQNKRDPVGIHWEKYTEIYALVDHKAVIVANTLFTNWLCRHGPPKELLSDQGREFVSELMQHFSKSLGITQIKATAFHPSSNGAVERQNRTVQDMIAV